MAHAAPAVTAAPMTYMAQTTTTTAPPATAVTYAAPSPYQTIQMAPTAAAVHAAPAQTTYAAPPTTYAAPSMAYGAPMPATTTSAFDMLDRNHDGVISRAEFAQAMQQQPMVVSGF